MIVPEPISIGGGWESPPMEIGLVVCALGLSHQDIARLIGAERETISKHLNQFKRAGALVYDRQRLFIRDQALLERIATGTTELVYEILRPY